MTSPEIFVLAGVKQYIETCESRNEKEDVENCSSKWMAQLLSSIKDIECGLCQVNRAGDAQHYKLKLTCLLLAKVMKNDQSVPSRCKLFDKFFNELRYVPNLNWGELFFVIYKSNLLSPFISLLRELCTDTQRIVVQQMKSWILESPFPAQENLHILDFCSFILFLLIYGTIFSLTSEPIFSEELVKYFGVILKEMDAISVTDEEFYYRDSLLNIQSFLAQFLDEMELSSIAQLDVLEVGQMNRVLSDPNVKNMSKEEFLKYDLLGKLSPCQRCNVPSGEYALQSKTSDDQLIEENVKKIKYLVDNISKLASASKTYEFVEAAQQFDEIHQLFARIIERMKSPAVLPEFDPHDYGNQLETVRHLLQGYNESARDLLMKMGDNPLAHGKWKEAFECFKESPECLASSQTLLLLIHVLSKMNDMTSLKENIGPLTEVALALQDLFLTGFSLITLKSKMNLCRTIISDPSKVSMISEYPFFLQNKDTAECDSFYLNGDKMLNSCFNRLVNVDRLNDSLLSSLSEISLLCPQKTVRKLIQQTFVNPKQTKLFLKILKDFHFLGEYKVKDDLIIWMCFHETVNRHWTKREYNFVENGLDFISQLLENGENSESLVGDFIRQIIFKSIMPSINSTREDANKCVILPELLSLKTLSSVIGTSAFIRNLKLYELAVFSVSLGANADKSSQFWVTNPNFDMNIHELLIECLEFVICKLTDMLSHLQTTDPSTYGTITKWTLNAIAGLKWTTKLRFMPIIMLCGNQKLDVPGSLAEVCTVPNIFQCSDDLSYGPGTGLIPWHQCFVVDPGLCPLSSLDISTLSVEETNLFTNGWIVTITQVLPFCLPHEWVTLLEASKLLIADFKIFIPLDTNHVKCLPILKLNESHVILSTVQLLQRAICLLGSGACVQWTFPALWLHVTKCYCMIISRLVNDSAEFDDARPESQLFMVAQVICKACEFVIIQNGLPAAKIPKNLAENVFIMCLDLMATFENIWQQEMSDAGENECDDSDLEDCEVKLKLQVYGFVEQMLFSVQALPGGQKREALISKLNSIFTSKE